MEGGGAAGGPSYAVEINPTAIHISPAEPCPFDAPLSLAIDFTASAPLAGAHWKLRYMVDMAHARHIIELAESEIADYGTDANRVAFELATIEFGALKDKPSKLANAGLLLATLFQGEAEIVQVSMLTQIDKAADGALTRVIYDPLQ